MGDPNFIMVEDKGSEVAGSTWKCCLGFHNWTKWRKVRVAVYDKVRFSHEKKPNSYVTKQSRECLRCGKIQTRKI